MELNTSEQWQSVDFTQPDFVEKVAHSNLMRALFCPVASDYKTDSRRGDGDGYGPVFDIDTNLDKGPIAMFKELGL